jgi:hypothetical protein
MKLRTSAAIIDYLDGDLIWRKKELTQFKFLLDASGGRLDRRDALLRAGLTLLYAHWEGFVKSAARGYLAFLAYQRLKYRELAPNFIALSARTLLRGASASDKIKLHLEVTEFFLHGLDAVCEIPVRDGITTRANLSFRVLKEILDTLGLDVRPYETKKTLIDEALLESRNTIAHGDYLAVTPDRWEELHREVIGMMGILRTAIGNAVVLSQYRAA